MDVLNMPVTLIVKAPNQQVEDQTIQCELNWTIRKLKGYLAEVYPSKPRTEDQKLIYSGQLLHDNVILKDILRWYEGQETHTVHLVCTPSHEALRFAGSVTPKAPGRMSENNQENSRSSQRETAQNPVSEVSSDGLRHRLSVNSSSPSPSVAGAATVSHNPTQVPCTSPSVSSSTVDTRAMWAAAMAQQYASIPGYDANTVSVQMAWMQQAYANYISQYMQYLAAGGVPNNWHAPSPSPLPVPTAQHGLEQPQPPVEQPVNQPNNAAVAPENEDDDGRGNRDWLDWFYTMSRVMVLFSIVYFYSSPTRFVIVSALGLMMYLYQLGFFRAQQQLQAARLVADNNNEVFDARVVAENNNVQNEDFEARVVADNNNVQNEGIAAAAAVQGHQAQEGSGAEPDPEPDRPSLFALTWTFFTSFFASLIPEQPGAL